MVRVALKYNKNLRDVFEVLKLSPIKTFENAKHCTDRDPSHGRLDAEGNT